MNKNALRPDAQAFDEVHITTIPRYKTSGLSGDEWRISAKISLYRKGILRYEDTVSTIEHACGFLYSIYHTAIDNGKAYFAGDGVTCDQEGCNKPKTVTYRRITEFKGYDKKLLDDYSIDIYRHFCNEHKTRGDCGLDDADNNYEKVNLA